ncbi:MAG TPA: response regulator [Pyrinomonadaceae bacterium]|nr:response regulator [Pyrinomonadaceae bacterium]
MLTYLGKNDKIRKEQEPMVPPILLVEDSTENRELLRRWLEQRGYRVVEAADGQEALDLAPLASPQLILMDLRLPKLNGMAVIRRLRRKPQLRKTPFIALSGLNPELFRDAALSEGFADYLAKPVDLGELEKVLKKFCSPTKIHNAS